MTCMVVWAPVSFYFSFLFLFFIIKLTFTYLQVLSPNDTTTPMSVQNKRPNDMYRHLGLGEFLFFLSFLMFHHSTNFYFLIYRFYLTMTRRHQRAYETGTRTTCIVIWAPGEFLFFFLFFFIIQLTLLFYRQVLSHNKTTTPASVWNRRPGAQTTCIVVWAPGEFLFFFPFLIFHHSTNATFLSTGLISQRHDNTNEHTKQVPKRHVSSFGPQVSFYFFFFSFSSFN